MMNIEQLAVEHGAELTPAYSESTSSKDTIVFTHEQLETFSKAYADNQEMYLLKVIADIRQAMGNANKLMLDELAPTIAKSLQQQSEPVGHVYIEQHDNGGFNTYTSLYVDVPDGTKLYTQPPNTVSLEQYNKLLDAFKHSRMTLELANLNELITDTIWASKSETLFDFMDNAIAEAERSAK